MFGANTITKGLTIGKVLGGISKGLSIANQVIPIYEQAKPMLKNAKKIMSVIKEFKKVPSDEKENTIKKKPIKNTIEKVEIANFHSINQPVFFQ